MRQMKPWEIKEAELLAKETAYLKNYNWLEKIADNELYYMIALVLLMTLGFDFGVLIGLML